MTATKPAQPACLRSAKLPRLPVLDGTAGAAAADMAMGHAPPANAAETAARVKGASVVPPQTRTSFVSPQGTRLRPWRTIGHGEGSNFTNVVIAGAKYITPYHGDAQSTFSNCSWLAGFDDPQVRYDQIGVSAHFHVPGRGGGPR